MRAEFYSRGPVVQSGESEIEQAGENTVAAADRSRRRVIDAAHRPRVNEVEKTALPFMMAWLRAVAAAAAWAAVSTTTPGPGTDPWERGRPEDHGMLSSTSETTLTPPLALHEC